MCPRNPFTGPCVIHRANLAGWQCCDLAQPSAIHRSGINCGTAVEIPDDIFTDLRTRSPQRVLPLASQKSDRENIGSMAIIGCKVRIRRNRGRVISLSDSDTADHPIPCGGRIFHVKLGGHAVPCQRVGRCPSVSASHIPPVADGKSRVRPTDGDPIPKNSIRPFMMRTTLRKGAGGRAVDEGVRTRSVAVCDELVPVAVIRAILYQTKFAIIDVECIPATTVHNGDWIQGLAVQHADPLGSLHQRNTGVGEITGSHPTHPTVLSRLNLNKGPGMGFIDIISRQIFLGLIIAAETADILHPAFFNTACEGIFLHRPTPVGLVDRGGDGGIQEDAVALNSLNRPVPVQIPHPRLPSVVDAVVVIRKLVHPDCGDPGRCAGPINPNLATHGKTRNAGNLKTARSGWDIRGSNRLGCARSRGGSGALNLKEDGLVGVIDPRPVGGFQPRTFGL